MRTIPGAILAIVPWVVSPLAVAAGKVPTGKEVTMPAIQYLANYEKKGLSLVVTVNDVVLEQWEGTKREQGGGPLNMWLRPGANRVRLRGTVAAGAAPRVDLT